MTNEEKMVNEENMAEEARNLGLGPTERYPHGQFHEDDKGELLAAVSHANGCVIINFGVAVSWLALPSEEAEAMCVAILHHAKLTKEEN